MSVDLMSFAFLFSSLQGKEKNGIESAFYHIDY